MLLKKTNELDKYYNSNLEDYNPELVQALREKDILYHLCNEIGYHQVELIQKDLADYTVELVKALREKDIIFDLCREEKIERQKVMEGLLVPLDKQNHPEMIELLDTVDEMGYSDVATLVKDRNMHTLQYLRWKLDKSKEKSDEM